MFSIQHVGVFLDKTGVEGQTANTAQTAKILPLQLPKCDTENWGVKPLCKAIWLICFRASYWVTSSLGAKRFPLCLDVVVYSTTGFQEDSFLSQKPLCCPKWWCHRCRCSGASSADWTSPWQMVTLWLYPWDNHFQVYWLPLQVKPNCSLHSAAKRVEKNALAIPIVAYHMAAFDSGSYCGIKHLKHHCVISITLIPNPKHSIIPAAREKINSIPAETRTPRVCSYSLQA